MRKLNPLISRRARDFNQQLPGFLRILASSLRSGISLEQSIKSTVAKDSSVLGQQFGQVLSKVDSGMSHEKALGELAERMKSKDLAWLVLAIKMQRELGGSFSSTLESASATIAQRAELRREVQVLSAEGRVSAYVLVALPFFAVSALALIQPRYLWFFVSSSAGWTLTALFFALVLLGFLWMRQIVSAAEK